MVSSGDNSREHFRTAAFATARQNTWSLPTNRSAVDVPSVMPAALLSTPTDMVKFAVADLVCAIGLGQVEEVLAMPSVTPLPETANHLLGAVDLHGTPLPVVDLHHLLGRPPVGIRPDQHLLILSGAGGRLAIRCDHVEGLVRTTVQPSPGAQSKAGFVLGLAQDADRLLLVLDAGALVDARPVAERTMRDLGKTGFDRT